MFSIKKQFRILKSNLSDAAAHPYTGALLQLLTLYTTPVVYLYLDRFRVWASALRTGHSADKNPSALPAE
jgi:hypothetical protein